MHKHNIAYLLQQTINRSNHLKSCDRMPRPKKYGEQKIEAYKLFQNRKAEGENPSAQDVHFDLQQAHGSKCASYRLVGDWIKEIKGQSDWQALLDSPFQWHQMELSQIPWEAGGFVTEMSRLVQEAKPHLRYPPLSVRQMRWAWRIHLATPELENWSSLWTLAQLYSQRELAHEVLVEPLYMDDLAGRQLYE